MKKCLFIVVFVCSLSGFSQQAMTFQNCLDLALQNNLDLKTAQYNEENAAYQYKASYGKLLPSVAAQAENKNTWGREIDPKTNLFVNEALHNYSGAINANFNLFSGFEAINTIKRNKQEVNISRANIERVRYAVTIDLAQKFITILYLQDVILANEDQIKASAKQLELAELKFNSGVISESEVFKVKSQKATEELTLLTNQNHLTDNLISLKQLMNMPLEQEIVLLKPNLELNENVAMKENQFSIISKAVDINPSYSMSLYREKAARAELGIARAMRYPTLGMRLSLGDNMTYSDTYYRDQLDANFSKGLRFTLTIPIFSQLDDFAKIKSAKMDYKQSKLDTQITRNQLSKEVLKAITDTKTSMKKNESSSIAYEFSRKSYEADEMKFQLGKININELNNTKMMFNKSQAELIQSKYELLFNNALIKFYLGEAFSL
jgi:outer membrane protein